MTLCLPGVDTLPPEHLRQEALSQWWTPDDTAERLAAWCGDVRGIRRVLEPSAGDGSLVRAFCARAPSALVDAVELDPRHIPALRERTAAYGGVVVNCCDYLARPAPPTPYDIAIMNPPYEGGLDSLFVAKAMRESVRVVALLRLAMLETQRTHDRVWSRVESGEWRLVGLAIFVRRPVFIAPGAESTGGMTAFAAVKLSRVPRADGEPVGTHVEWW